MSEAPVRKVPETNDPASAPPRPSASPQQQQQQVPPQHQQQEHRLDPRQEQRQEQRQESRQDARAEERRDERREERQDQRTEQRHEQRPVGKLEDEWRAVQYEFVDDPKAAVRKADDLVTRAIEELTSRHRSLAKQLEGNGDPQTEDLRLALHRYRELFKSLVATK
ncbi:hypothetical protein [Lentzea aerocolonigenes]|uniref:hypothetical protein n=1 Tax=Lentzea aerocolonigenes TaxID=68170 RepID=UPI000B046ED1|nr:hypothetical protein [Lentzea aerocolonigenes]